MNRQEEELLAALRAEFAIEAVEHLRAVTDGLLELEKAPAPDQQAKILESIYRQSHSLKGESRAVNFSDMEVICQALEGVFSAWKRGDLKPRPGDFDMMYGVLDSIRAMLAGEGAMGPNERNEIVAKLTGFEQGGARQAKTAPEAFPPPVESEGVKSSDVGAKTGADETVRMPLSRIEALLLGLEELLAVKLSLARRADALLSAEALFEQRKRLAAKITTEVRSFAGIHGGLPASLDDLLEHSQDTLGVLGDSLATLSREAEHDAHLTGRLVDDLLDQSKKLMMLPFNTLLGILPRQVRDLCRDQGKEADVVIRGGDIEIDKRILQEMKDPLIHLVRNCVDHGLETVAARTEKNKPGRGSITVEVLPVDAGTVELVVKDDGAGVDVEEVKKVAVKQGVISASAAARLSRDKAIALIFLSAVSTSRVVTAVSGRGLGMAIVKERVEALGGQVMVETTSDAGSAFRIKLPLVLSTFRGTFVDAGGRWFILPSTSVHCVARVRREAITMQEGQVTVVLAGQAFPLVRLEDVLGLPPVESESANTSLVHVAAVKVGGKQMAFGVDEILMEREVLVKSFVKPLSRVRNVSGATVLPSGRVVPILNVSDLIKTSALPVPLRPPGVAKVAAVPKRPKTLLLVEDSIISRMLFKSILESAGYGVQTVVDGQEAWEALQEGNFDAVVSDVEMPRLNGFELTSLIRNDARFADKPVVLVTGLSSPEDRARGIAVGANSYIVKTSFDQSDLLEALRRVV